MGLVWDGVGLGWDGIGMGLGCWVVIGLDGDRVVLG